MKKYC